MEATNKHKSISVPVSRNTETRLNKAVLLSGRSKKEEVMVRLAHSLKFTDKIEDDYWELIAE